LLFLQQHDGFVFDHTDALTDALHPDGCSFSLNGAERERHSRSTLRPA
jgi:hypothetical protein